MSETNKEPACSCPESGGWCERYSLRQDPHHVYLCRTSSAYREKWAKQKANGRVPVAVMPNPPRGAPCTNPRPGAGSHLKLILESVGIKADGCSCNSLAAEMDARGVEWCREYREMIVTHLQSEAGKRSWWEKVRAAVLAVKTGLAFAIDPTDLFGSLLDEAIRRAEIPPAPLTS